MKRVVILGNETNVIFHQVVQHFLQDNSKVYVFDQKLIGTNPNLKVVFPVTLNLFERIILKTIPRITHLLDLLTAIFYFCLTLQFRRIEEFWSMPNLKRPMYNMILYSRTLKRLDFDYAICLNVYFYGLCSIITTSRSFVAQPWGSDVNKYGVSTPLRLFLMKRCLASMTYIAPAGRSVIPFIESKYGVSKSKFVFLSPKVDASIFYPIVPDEKAKIRLELNIEPTAVVFFACRRFAEGWGPRLIQEIFIKLYRQIPNSYFIVLSGCETNNLINQFKAELTKEQLKGFLFLDRTITLEEFSRYSQISNFTVSAMTNRDMQSFSIMQSTACGAYPILLEQEEYRLMEADGFNALLFKTIDEVLFNRICDLAKDSESLIRLTNRNLEYFNRVGSQQSYVSKLNNLSYP